MSAGAIGRPAMIEAWRGVIGPFPAVTGPGAPVIGAFPATGSVLPADCLAIVARHLVVPERPAPEIDPSNEARRHPPVPVRVRADDELGVGWEIDRPVADPLAVDVERGDVSVPRRHHVVATIAPTKARS